MKVLNSILDGQDIFKRFCHVIKDMCLRPTSNWDRGGQQGIQAGAVSLGEVQG